jgi:hypothetical protein
LLALTVWLAITLQRDAATSTEHRRTTAGLLFAGGFALAIFLLATLIGGGRLRAAIPFTLDGESGADPLDALGAQVRALGDALFAVLTSGALDPSTPAWRDPLSAFLAVAGAILALRLGRRAALWWCLALIPTLLAGLFGDGDPNATIRVLLLLPGYAFVAFALDALMRWERLREPGAQLVAVSMTAALVLLNVVGFALWSTEPATLAAQGPTIATRDFYLWRDYQVSNLALGRGIVGPDEYATLAPAAIVEQIAAARRIAEGGTALENAAPRDNIGKEVGTIGIGENGGHLDAPHALAIDRQGDYYVADTARGVIVHFGANGSYSGEWTTAQTGQPWAIVATLSNILLVLDADSGRIGRYDNQGHFLGLALAPEGMIATRGLGIGGDGKVYVAQTAANRVVRIDPLAQWAAEPLGGSKQPTTFDQPTAALADAGGNVVIYEPDGARLRGISAGGQVRFNRAAPRNDTINAGSLAILPEGRIALVDAIGSRIVIYGATGNLVGAFPITGAPRGIAVTPLGLIAVTDLQEKIIRLYTLITP